ncbi:MAG: hypothetical protein HY046_00225 [Acidobacteria bacterium]|nr:hypothetical protein [Acidobacteriota bacterium]
MTRTSFAFFLVGAILFSQDARNPRPRIIYPMSILGPSLVQIPDNSFRKGFTLWIEEDHDARKRKETFPEDFLLLRLLPTNQWQWNKPILERKFESSYGKFDLCLVDLTGDKKEEFVLITGKNHGTSVRAETLEVFQLSGRALKQLLSIEVSGFFGMGQWWYRREYVDVNGDGITDLRLVLSHDPISASAQNDPTLIPRTKELDFVFDKTSGKLVVYRIDR